MRIFLAPSDSSRPFQMLALCMLNVSDEIPRNLGLPASQSQSFTAAVRSTFSHSSIQDCDFILIPYSAVGTGDIEEMELKYSSFKKPIVAFLEHDTVQPIPSRRTLVLRTSVFRSNMLTNERVIPALCSDPMLEIKDGNLNDLKVFTQSIGFCGYVGSSIQVQILKLLGKSEKSKGLALRRHVLRTLESETSIKTDFIRRHRFRAGMTGDINKIKFNTLRFDYIRNLLVNQFSICIRGAGNFSFRFYEALACGRIPILVESDDVLPLEEKINYKKHIVKINIDELNSVSTKIDEFLLKTVDPIEILLESNRKLWLQSLSPEGFICNELPSLVRDWSHRLAFS